MLCDIYERQCSLGVQLQAYIINICSIQTTGTYTRLTCT